MASLATSLKCGLGGTTLMPSGSNVQPSVVESVHSTSTPGPRLAGMTSSKGCTVTWHPASTVMATLHGLAVHLIDVLVGPPALACGSTLRGAAQPLMNASRPRMAPAM